MNTCVYIVQIKSSGETTAKANFENPQTQI